MGKLTIQQAVKVLKKHKIEENTGTLRYKLHRGVITGEAGAMGSVWMVDEACLHDYIRRKTRRLKHDVEIGVVIQRTESPDVTADIAHRIPDGADGYRGSLEQTVVADADRQRDVYASYYTLYMSLAYTGDGLHDAEVELMFVIAVGAVAEEDVVPMVTQLAALQQAMSDKHCDRQAWRQRWNQSHKTAVKRNMKLDAGTLYALLDNAADELKGQQNIVRNLHVYRALRDAAVKRGMAYRRTSHIFKAADAVLGVCVESNH